MINLEGIIANDRKTYTLHLHVVTFYFQVSYSEWPIDIFEGDFYNMYISGKPYEHNYAAIHNFDPSSMSDSDFLTAERLVKKNFLSAYILIEPRMKEYQDTSKLTLVSLFAQMAATLNLWAGITVIIVIEFIELLHEIIRKKRVPNKEGSEWYMNAKD